jgi:hypothetical protein
LISKGFTVNKHGYFRIFPLTGPDLKDNHIVQVWDHIVNGPMQILLCGIPRQITGELYPTYHWEGGGLCLKMSIISVPGIQGGKHPCPLSLPLPLARQF